MNNNPTPEETARNLVDKFWDQIEEYPSAGYEPQDIEWQIGKQCALIAVDEIWKGIDSNFHAHPDKPALSENTWNNIREYWNEVKKHINAL